MAARVFKALYVVQTPGAPFLSITPSNAAVVIFWPAPTPGWQLEYTTTLTGGAGSWTLIPPPYTTNDTTISVTQPATTGNRFFRLHKP